MARGTAESDAYPKQSEEDESEKAVIKPARPSTRCDRVPPADQCNL